MDPNRRYISRVSTNGMIGGYTDYRSVNPYAGYTTPVYPGYQNLMNNNRPPVLVDTTANYDTHLRSLFHPARNPSYNYDSMTVEKRNAMKRFEQSEKKTRYSRSTVLAVISFLVIIAIVAVIISIVYGVKAADVTQVTTTTPMPSTITNSSNLLRGTLILDNLLYDESLKDPGSDLFKLYKNRICKELIDTTKDALPVTGCDVTQMSHGSLLMSWVLGMSSTNGMSSTQLEIKTSLLLTTWLETSSIFHGRIGPVYEDSCALLSSSDNPCEQICVNSVDTGQPQCKCENGFELNSDGKTCHDINECLTAGCPADCQNTEGGYKCKCPSGYRQADNGKDCTDVDECAVSNGHCEQICNNTVGGYDCLCFSGFTSINNSCLSLCDNIPDVCPTGYIQQENGSCIDIDECESSPCDVNCTNTNGSFYCICDPGTILASDHKQCLNGNLSLDRDQQAVVPLGTDISVTCILWASDKMTQDITIEWYTPDMEIIEDDLAERKSSVCFKRSGYRQCMLTLINNTESDNGNYVCVARYDDIPVSHAVLQLDVEGFIKPCDSGHVSCNNTNKCIPESYLCDNYDDCGDGEDEINCFCNGFRCSNYKCIPIDRWCNKRIDCPDGADEMQNCTLFCPDGFVKCNYSLGQCVPANGVCQPDYACDGGENNRHCSSCNEMQLIKCNNTGRCVTPESKCNGVNDCGDWEDELDCVCFPKSRCPKTGVCLSNELFCDGNNDCKDGEDERKPCHINCTSIYTVQCNSTNDCIYTKKLCDGENDCGDWEDEKNCGQCLQRSSRDPKIHTHFRCDSGECLHYGLLCDGYSDCPDGSDENNCDGDCPPNFMRCNNTIGRQCIPEDYRCDYYYHCEDGEDEVGCGFTSPCADSEFFCNNTHKCVSKKYRCDGEDDCGDHEDEQNCPCGASEFLCSNNMTCRAYNTWCNGKDDCGDNSDELVNCTSFCPEGLFHCDSVDKYHCLPPFMLCNSHWDCADGADEQNCECRYKDQLKCNGSYLCIWDTQLCDGKNDCGDLEDELGCGPCSNTEFKCTEIDVCMSEDKWCDSTKDCPKGSDEPDDCLVCDKRCAPNEIKCDNKCLSGAKICDGVLDCSDNSDEKYCNCTDKQFKCHMGLCIDKARICDRHIDCPDQSDEWNCTKPCGDEMFPCATGDLCISKVAHCDGQINCRDESDEQSCGPCNKDRDWSIFDVTTITSTVEVRRRLNKIRDVGPFNVSCTMGMCIPAEFWCNEIIDCPDGSDESSCKPDAELNVTVVTEWIMCPPSWFRCTDNRKCIPPKYVCDLLSDCDDESDEGHQCICPPPSNVIDKLIPPTTFAAAKYRVDSGSNNQQQTPPANISDWRRCNSTGVCFWSIFLCDGWSICEDGTDESGVGCSDYDLCVNYPDSHGYCDSGECIPLSEFCDSEPNCVDKSDEIHCTKGSCKGFLCDGGRCVPSLAKCNGRKDCYDWTDELGCNCNPATQYTCPSSTVCIDKLKKCDLVPNCPNMSDESTCTGTSADCYPEQFFCDGRCIDKEHVCDGTPNCKDYSDEKNCDCSFLTFNCTMGFCLSRDKWCDGIVDCPDGSDEPDHCRQTCPPNFYWCEIEDRCIHPYEVCHSSSLSLCQANTTEPEIDCSSMQVSESLCGLPAIYPHDIVPFIFNGDEAMPHSWPWLIGLRSHYHGDIVICGGSIIHPEWIVTAAHCVELSSSLDNYKVIIGMHRKDQVDPYQEELSIAQIIMHEKWDTYQLLNDIALIKLVKPVTYNRHVRPVCVPKTNFAPGKICTVIGWGDTLGTAEDNPLRQARLPIIKQETCQYWHRETSNVTSTMICAGYEDGRRGNCYGDSGGPLLCSRQGRFWIQGLVTWGKNGCKAEEAPMVFTRVPSFYDWINKYVEFDTPTK